MCRGRQRWQGSLIDTRYILYVTNKSLFKATELIDQYNPMVKTFDWILSFILEDLVEVGLQFFYFEKYQFLNDTFTNINAGFMVVKTFDLALSWMIVIIKQRKLDEEDQGKFLLKPISRYMDFFYPVKYVKELA